MVKFAQTDIAIAAIRYNQAHEDHHHHHNLFMRCCGALYVRAGMSRFFRCSLVCSPLQRYLGGLVSEGKFTICVTHTHTQVQA